jgi:hypothetical protein
VGSDEWAPPGVDPRTASVARVYDYIIGGKDNYAVDRAVGDAMIAAEPDTSRIALTNRAFLRRAVHHMVNQAGIRQFLDIGSGLPTQGNVHEVAQEITSSVRVIYIDKDLATLHHGQTLLADSDNTRFLQGDVRRPLEILDHPNVVAALDFSQPIGLLLFAVLHHLADDEQPSKIIATFRDALCPGSYLAISHFFDPAEDDPAAGERVRRAEQVFRTTLGTGRWRTRRELLDYFGDLELLAPGVVPVSEWRAEPGRTPQVSRPTQLTMAGGVAVRR